LGAQLGSDPAAAVNDPEDGHYVITRRAVFSRKLQLKGNFGIIEKVAHRPSAGDTMPQIPHPAFAGPASRTRLRRIAAVPLRRASGASQSSKKTTFISGRTRAL